MQARQKQTILETTGRFCEMKQKKEPRVAVTSSSGHTVYLPVSQVAAFKAGQEALRRGEQPKDKEQRVSELLSKLLGQKE